VVSKTTVKNPMISETMRKKEPYRTALAKPAFLAYVETVGPWLALTIGAKVNPRSKSGKILSWLGERIPSKVSFLSRQEPTRFVCRNEMSNPVHRNMEGFHKIQAISSATAGRR